MMTGQNRFSKIFGIIFGTIGLAFFIIGMASLFYRYNYAGDMVFMIIGMTFSIIGGIFLIIGICALGIALRHKRKVQRLKREGRCYNADIVRVYEKSYIHINYRSPFVVECSYKDSRGRSYLVKSGNVWRTGIITREMDIKARVWVNQNNPKDYYVEVYNAAIGDPDMKYDFDYR